VRWLSDKVLDHLRQAADWPDLGGTRYELVEKIGQGGMASVYLAKDRELDRPVALKVLNAGPGDGPARARLANEARIIAALEHPGIVPVHDAGILPDGRLYYAMKLVRGKRLDEHLSLTGSLVERLQLFEKVCQAVAFAHAHGVVHRDLKPQNIMVGSFGEVLVMDWGIAKLRAGDGVAGSAVAPSEPPDAAPPAPRTGTAHGTVLGTPGYMAPEQACGEIDLIDERTDVYALGAILHYLLAGHAPPAPSPGGGEDGVRTDAPRQRHPSVPRSLEAVCRKALAADRGERYASVPELADEVARFLAGLRVEAHPETLFEAASRLASKYRVAIVLVLAYLAMRILLLVFAGT
jgi:serine/threonine protein kinase